MGARVHLTGMATRRAGSCLELGAAGVNGAGPMAVGGVSRTVTHRAGRVHAGSPTARRRTHLTRAGPGRDHIAARALTGTKPLGLAPADIIGARTARSR